MGDNVIQIDDAPCADYSGSYGYQIYCFTAPNSGKLTVQSKGAADTYGAFYKIDGSEMVHNDDGGEDKNFLYDITVKKDEAYLIGIRAKNGKAFSGDYIISITGDRTMGVDVMEADTTSQSVVCDILGRRTATISKGINIVRQSNGKAVKVISK